MDEILLVARKAKYGWIPDLPDQRDFTYLSLAPHIPSLPEKVDLRANCSPVEDQQALGSCTANALVGNLEYLKKQRLNQLIDFSRLFLYYNERVIEKTTAVDSGASLRDGIKTLVKAGDCEESRWPYDITQFAVKPSVDAYAEALEHQVVSYYRIKSTMEMKHTLSLGFPFVFGFAVYDSFESEVVASTGIVPLPHASERLLGGHAVMAVGYDDTQNRFIVRNSWGTNWGDGGYCYMPYAYLGNAYLASDFWTIRDME
jgi:C1A family cysteine protease